MARSSSARKRSRPQPPPPTGAAQRALREAFLERSVPALKQLAEHADRATLKKALAAPSDVGGIAAFLSAVVGASMQLGAVDPLAGAVARGAKVKEDLLEAAGGAFSSVQVAKLLGISRQAVDKRRQSRALLAVPTGTGDWRYPACQFGPDGVVPGIERVLRAFSVAGPWTQLSALLGPVESLGGRSLLEALTAGEVAAAAAVAAGVGEHGA